MNIEDLKQSFTEDLFLRINDLLVGGELIKSKLAVSPDNSKLITNARYFGSYDDLDLHIITVEHTATQDARVGVSLDIFKLMKKYSFQNALVATYAKNTDTWRYSLVTSNLLMNDKGKITRKFSNPRRYSFVLGPNQKVLTPYKQLIQSGKVLSVEELSKRFSLEAVNNEFYKEIAKLYDELVGTDTIIKKLIYPKTGDESHEFVVRLIGRIIFCWFLREKKSKAGISLVPSQILSREAANQTGYYHNTLAPLFFEVLNRPIAKRRSEKFKTGVYADIPYLNGGLFSDDTIDQYKFDKALGLSVPGLVEVPDLWLHKLLDLLERFNFTVDENTSYDTDLSIDPEMLGRVFENLLARINPETGETVRKSTGSFYTPREIVDYMVDNGISEYLVAKTSVSKKKVDALISYDIFDDHDNELSKEEAISVLQALSTLTVLDPACGSGAFPIGMLQKIVFIITKLDPDAEWWLAKQLEGASPELRREFANRGVDYIRKLGVIRQTIFGVDIQPIATEISRLRCFLTLIVDEVIDDSQDNRGIRSLPNLEFKFVTANSLLGLPDQKFSKGHVQQNMFDNSQKEKIEKLKVLIDEYFSANSGDKSEIKAEYRYVQNQLWNDMHKSSAYGQQSLALTDWDPFDHSPCSWFDPEWMFGIPKGFDIIIANPPYVTTKYGKISNEMKAIFKDSYESAYDKIDLYVLFIERAVQLSNDGGLTVYITPWNFLGNFYSFKIRGYLLKNTKILLFNKLPPRIFDSAIVDNIISILKKDEDNANHEILFDNIVDKNKQEYVLQDTYKNNDKFVFDLPTNDFDKKLILKVSEGSKPLGKIATNYIGIMTGGQKEMIADSPIFKISKPVLGGKDISKWSYVNSGKFVNFDKSKIHSNSNEEIYESPKKILLRKTGKILAACIDEEQFYTIQSLYNIVVRDTSFSEEYLLGFLNSKLANYLYNHFYITNPEVFPYIKRRHLDMMPIKIIDSHAQKVISRIVNQIVEAKSKKDDNYVHDLESQLDNKIYETYEITSEQILLIESDPCHAK